jgi:hypothetical protein
MKKSIIAVGAGAAFAVAIVLAFYVLISSSQPQPYIKVDATNLRFGWVGSSYVAYVNVSLTNVGNAAGTANVEVKFLQNSLDTRTVTIFLNPSQSTTFTEEFNAQYGFSGISYSSANIISQKAG